jgi:hypothetical protein
MQKTLFENVFVRTLSGLYGWKINSCHLLDLKSHITNFKPFSQLIREGRHNERTKIVSLILFLLITYQVSVAVTLKSCVAEINSSKDERYRDFDLGSVSALLLMSAHEYQRTSPD